MIREAKGAAHVRIEHPRQTDPGQVKPSRVVVWATLEGKREDIVQIEMGETALYSFAEDVLKHANILRRLREDAERYVRSIP